MRPAPHEPGAHPAPPRRVVRTYLGMDAPDALVPAPCPQGVRLIPIAPCSVPRWRALYADIGGPWAWHDRDAWPDAHLARHLADPAVRIFTVGVPPGAWEAPGGGADARETEAPRPPEAGFLELHRHPDASVEIAYLGVHAALLGRGLGGWLVTAAVQAAWQGGARRVWLHTCTLDAPAALPNYLRRGFRVERTEEYDAPPRP